MHYPTILASALAFAANAAAAVPRPDNSNAGLTLTLRTGEIDLPPILFPEPRDAISKRLRSKKRITEVELNVGEGVKNQDIRCQIQDEHRQPIVVLRGNNTDVTLADGGNGPWTLREPSVVGKVTCDQGFEKIEPDDERLRVRVIIQSQNPELGRSFDLSGVVRNEVDVQEQTPIETVTLEVDGELVDPALRCQIVGADGPITVLRGENVKQTFADGDGGPWTLQEETVVEQIICDPEFQNQE